MRRVGLAFVSALSLSMAQLFHRRPASERVDPKISRPAPDQVTHQDMHEDPAAANGPAAWFTSTPRSGAIFFVLHGLVAGTAMRSALPNPWMCDGDFVKATAAQDLRPWQRWLRDLCSPCHVRFTGDREKAEAFSGSRRLGLRRGALSSERMKSSADRGGTVSASPRSSKGFGTSLHHACASTLGGTQERNASACVRSSPAATTRPSPTNPSGSPRQSVSRPPAPSTTGTRAMKS